MTANPAVGKNAIRVLHVEDNADDALLVERMLRQPPDQFELEHVFGLDGARAKLSDHCVDIILLDLELAGSSQSETLAKVRAWTDLPIIVLSGHSSPTTILTAVRDGVRDFFVKGRTDASVLQGVLRSQVEWWRQTHNASAARRERSIE